MKEIFFTVLIMIMILVHSSAYTEHVFEDAFGQYPDIAELSSEKFTLTVDENSFDLSYGFHASLDSMISDEPNPKLSSMSINQERKSLEIIFEEVSVDSVFWVKMPQEVIFAEKENFQLLIDEVDTQYDLTKHSDNYSIGMILPKDAIHVEVIGTNVIPEFSEYVGLVFVIGILLMLIFLKKFEIRKVVKL